MELLQAALSECGMLSSFEVSRKFRNGRRLCGYLENLLKHLWTMNIPFSSVHKDVLMPNGDLWELMFRARTRL